MNQTVSKEEIKAVARKISTQSQISKQYFELGTLFLVNDSFHNDPNHFWEYTVYKLDHQGNAYKFESITVNMRGDDGKWLGDWLINWERTSFEDMTHPISGQPLTKYGCVPYRQVQQFKQEFEQLKETF